MTEKQFLKLISDDNNKKEDFIYEEIVNLLSENKKEKKFVGRIIDKIRKKPNLPKKILENNFELIFEKVSDGYTKAVIEIFSENRELKPILKDNIQIVLRKVMSNYYNLQSIYGLINDNNLLEKNLDFILNSNPKIEHIFFLKKYLIGKSEEIDEKIEKCFRNRKLEFSKFLLDERLEHDNNKIIENYSLTTSVLIEEILESEDANYTDIDYIGSGTYSDVYKIKNKVIKISGARETYKIPNHRRILQPLLRIGLIDEENNKNIGYIEITDRVETLIQRERNVNKLYELYKELRDNGIIWTDVRFDNVGKLKKDNIPNLNGEKMYVNPNSVGFLNELEEKSETLKKGDWVIIDTDFIYKDKQDDISFAIDGYGLDFDYRYKNEKNPEKRKNEVKKFIEELDFEDR